MPGRKPSRTTARRCCADSKLLAHRCHRMTLGQQRVDFGIRNHEARTAPLLPPFALALHSPARARSAIRLCSNSATAPRNRETHLAAQVIRLEHPCGVQLGRSASKSPLLQPSRSPFLETVATFLGGEAMRFVRFVCLFAVLSSMLVLAQSNRAPVVNQPNGMAQQRHPTLPPNLSQMPQGAPFAQRGARALKRLGTGEEALPMQGGLNFAPAVAYGSGGDYGLFGGGGGCKRGRQARPGCSQP